MTGAATSGAGPSHAEAGPGLFGKLPSRGDFVVRRLDAACREGLDTWLQAGIATSRRQMGDDWLDAYLNAPVWRFVLGADVCGSAPLAGVLMPSVDRVGRYFPLVLAAQLPGRKRPQDLYRTAADWYAALEDLVLTALQDGTDLAAFDEAVGVLGLPAADGTDASPAAVGTDAGTAMFWFQPRAEECAVLLYSHGLPRPQGFTSLLSPHWPSSSWRPAKSQSLPGVTVLVPREEVAMASAGRTHAGTRRPMNQDALLIRPERGLWAVADGVGGHDSGEVASRIVVEHLQQVLPPLSLEGVLDEAHKLLAEANEVLCSQAEAISDASVVASTVAVLAVHEGCVGVLWSGDSRIYRLRAGALDCLTEDHVEDGAICHAVGSAKQFVSARAVHASWPDDRYLLCSDGLTKALEEGELAAHLARPTPEEAVAALMDDALVAGARDNVTVVVVHVRSVA